MDRISKNKNNTYYNSVLFNIKNILIIICLLTLSVSAATISISDDIRVYASLTDTVVDMSEVSELHVTNATSPLSGCTINLNSEDSWLFLENIIPSVAASSYLGQVKVNGSQGVINNNVRVVQYADGAVIIPHSTDFMPLQIFDEDNFAGSFRYLSQYTEYGTASLGSMSSTISSFILKRGYTATFAQNEDGSGYSKNYVAQDCDLEIGVLPEKLKGQVRFIRIFPWRWVSKKGIAGNIGSNLDIKWWYDWNLDQNSPLDKEYVPIRQKRWWPELSQDWKTRGATHLLGYNEPDSSDQANIAVGDAIWSWPDLLATGLRLGSPATTDGGRESWLYPFIEQADTDDLRVDFVAVHYYWCYSPSNASGAATQMYNYLKAVHDNTGRPIWVTEWNNGANWTQDYCSDPTYAQQAAAISAMVDMLESTPWVERYALYNWVEDVRRVEWDDGSLTSAGEVYRDKISSIGYQQEVPDNGSKAIAFYLFDDNFRDISVNGNHPLVYGAPKKPEGKDGNAIVLDGNDDYLRLPTNMGNSDDFSFSGWVYWNGGSQWQRVFDFGSGTSNYMFITPSAYSSQLRFAISTSGYNGEQRLESGSFPVGKWTHVAVTLEGNVGRLYVNGSQVDVETITLNPSNLSAVNNYIGKSQFDADPLFDGMLDNVFFADYALSASKISEIYLNHAPQFSLDVLDGGDATPDFPYSGDISGFAADSDNSDEISFSKISGPAWLDVAVDGTLSGTPTVTDSGLNTFIIRVSDGKFGFDQAILNISVDYIYSMIAEYPFDGNDKDIAGSNDGTSVGSPGYTTGKIGTAIDLDGSSDYVILPAGIFDTENISIATWVYWDGGSNWQRIFDFGNGTSSYMFLTPSSSSNTLRFAFKNGGSEQLVETTGLSTGAWTHVAVTINGDTGSIYVNGILKATNASMTINPSDFNPQVNYIGDSQWSSDPLFNGRIDDFRIYNYALSVDEIALLSLPPSFTSDTIVNLDAIELNEYTGTSLAAYAENYVYFIKESGPSWLHISPDGSLSGIAGDSDAGTNTFTVRADNKSGSFDTAQLHIEVANLYSGTQGIEDLSGMASQWLQNNCDDTPACNGASLDGDNTVSLSDMSIMSQTWVEDDTLQLYLKFDETGGDVALGSSLYHRTAQLMNGPAWISGYFNGGLSFDGVDDYIQVADFYGIGDAQSRTITAWINADAELANSETGLHAIASWGKGDSVDLKRKMILMLDSAGQLSLAIYGARLYGGSDLEDGTWHHVAMVLPDGTGNINQVKLYVDGAEIETNAAGLDAVIDTAFTEDVLVGAYDSDMEPGVQTPVGYFKGIIDEVKIYNKGLTGDEITNLFE